MSAEIHTAEAPLPPEQAAATMLVPEGFKVTLFAGEPDVQQPISFCIDDRGRLWVAEAYNYPHHGTTPGDRILILEDSDGDGRHDKRTVFFDGLNYVTGIEVGFGGAWVMSPPCFYFIPDRDGDDRPDAEPTILLDGFGNHANAHNLANGFAWGPDGWLYGTHGRTNWSMLGKPGTPEDQRVRFDGGVYRYHPVRHVWEPVADGTTNPWGIDWDDYGQAFVCNCVNPHLFHVIAGAHYEPWRNRESSLYAYERIPTIADHLHFIGKGNVRDGLGSPQEDEAGGGHAHCGTMVYLGDNWPDRYRNSIFMNNIHGRRINNDLLRRSGSGYTASHASDLMRSQDPWFMGVTLLYGPEGAVYVSDWSDTGECHSVKNTRRETGRIYRIAYGEPTRVHGDLTELGDAELVDLQRHRNDWYVRHARRLLQERASAGQDMHDLHRRLRSMFEEESDVPRRLRAVWALYVTGGVDDDFLIGLLDDESEYLRAWGVQLLCEDRDPPVQAIEHFCELATSGDSPFVRLHLASALQRLAPAERWKLAEALLMRGEDADDANLPLMIWYGIEPLVNNDLTRFVGLTGHAQIPLVRRHIARRAVSSDVAEGLATLIGVLGGTVDDTVRSDVLEGMLLGLEGRRQVPMPAAWEVAYSGLSRSDDRDVQEQSLRLALIFDDPKAINTLRQRMVDTSAGPELRCAAISALAARKLPDLDSSLLNLLADPDVRVTALQALSEYEHPQTAEQILSRYVSLDPHARQHALETLASRRSWAEALLDGLQSGRVPRSDLTAFTARQLESLDDERITLRLRTLWGEVRPTADDRLRQITALRKRLTPEVLEHADLSAGRAVYQKQCANCHRLFDAGAAIGPDLTGAQRTNLDYLLENVIDPSASVARDFQMEVVVTSAGRVITGLVVAESPQALTMQTANERIVIPADEVEARRTSSVSMMPDGLLNALSFEATRDLFSYLAALEQVNLPDTTGGPSAHEEGDH